MKTIYSVYYAPVNASDSIPVFSSESFKEARKRFNEERGTYPLLSSYVRDEKARGYVRDTYRLVLEKMVYEECNDGSPEVIKNEVWYQSAVYVIAMP